jgi:hypothetical protein
VVDNGTPTYNGVRIDQMGYDDLVKNGILTGPMTLASGVPKNVTDYMTAIQSQSLSNDANGGDGSQVMNTAFKQDPFVPAQGLDWGGIIKDLVGVVAAGYGMYNLAAMGGSFLGGGTVAAPATTAVDTTAANSGGYLAPEMGTPATTTGLTAGQVAGTSGAATGGSSIMDSIRNALTPNAGGGSLLTPRNVLTGAGIVTSAVTGSNNAKTIADATAAQTTAAQTAAQLQAKALSDQKAQADAALAQQQAANKALIDQQMAAMNLQSQQFQQQMQQAQQTAATQLAALNAQTDAANRALMLQSEATGKASQSQPGTNSAITQAQRASAEGQGGTMLTGASGSDSDTLKLGRNTLLGSK